MSLAFILNPRIRCLALVAWMACGALPAQAAKSKKQEKDKQPPASPAKQVASKVQPPKVPGEDPSPVPETGTLTVEQLILLAHYNSPQIQRLKSEAAVARWRKEAARDWRDPEIRWGWDRQFDVPVDAPYTERSVSTERYAGSEFENQLTTGNGEFRRDRTSQRTRDNRYKIVERRVIPGATRTVVETREYEVRRQSQGGRRGRTEYDLKNGLVSRSDAVSAQTTRRQTGFTRTVTTHPDVTEPDYSFGLGLRLFLPNPLEIRARVAKAEGDIALADAELAAAEDRLAREVRALHEDLSFLEAQKGGLKSLADHAAAIVESMENLWTVYGADKLAKAREDQSEVLGDLTNGEFAAQKVRIKLCRLVGLGDPSRIQAATALKRRMVDVNSLDRAYLLQMASVYRADLAEAIARNQIAEGEYRREKANKVPWVGFIEFGYDKSWNRGDTGPESFGIRGAVSVPIFSWFKNKSARAAQEEMRETSREIGLVHRRIETSLDLALNELRAAQAAMAAVSHQQSKVKAYATQNEALAAQAGIKGEEIQSSVKKMVIRSNLDGLEAGARYNAAVQLLEEALGTSLENVLKSHPK